MIDDTLVALTLVAALGSGLAAVAAIEWNEPQVYYQLAGSALYVIGTVVVTIAFNVPRNDALATADPKHADSAGLWQRYLGE